MNKKLWINENEWERIIALLCLKIKMKRVCRRRTSGITAETANQGVNRLNAITFPSIHA